LIADERMHKFLRPLLRSFVQNVADDRFYASLLQLVGAKSFASSRLPEVVASEAFALEGERTTNQVHLLAAVLKSSPTIFREVAAQRLGQGGDIESVEELLSRVEMDAPTTLPLVANAADSAQAFRQLLSRPSIEASALQAPFVAALSKADAAFTEVIFDSENAVRLLDAVPAHQVFSISTSVVNSPEVSRSVASAHLSFLAGPFLARHPTEAEKLVRDAFWARLLVTKSSKKSAIDAWKAQKGSELEKGGMLRGEWPSVDSHSESLGDLNAALADIVASKKSSCIESCLVQPLTDGATENVLADSADKEARLDFLLGQLRSKGSSSGSLLARMGLAQAIAHSPATDRASLALRVLEATASVFEDFDHVVQPDRVSGGFQRRDSL
jgi:hypothetical protein